MPWILKASLLIAAIGVLVFLCRQITRRLARRTLTNWSGHGINEKLTPVDVAILLGRHPGVVGYVVFDGMHAAGKARLISDDPLRLDCPPGSELDPVESSFAAAIDEDGEFDEARTREFLEVAWERTNEKMIDHSGRATAVFWRDLVNDLAARLRTGESWEPEDVPWLLLSDSATFWERIEDSPEGDALKGRCRLRNRFHYRMVDSETLRDWGTGSKEGFFAFPREISFSDF